MRQQNTDPNFEQYRRERTRHRTAAAASAPAEAGPGGALRELEAVEQREMKDKMLTREVHDFFEAATKQAATIVERVSADAKAEMGNRMRDEMEAFLFDAYRRMNTLVAAVLGNNRNGQLAESQLVPNVQNLVGPLLDSFRGEGTAQQDKHFGQDPFDTDPEEVRKELAQLVEQAVLNGGGGEGDEGVLVSDNAAEEPARVTAAAGAKPSVEEHPYAEKLQAAAEKPKRELTPDMKKLQDALRALVRQGLMSKDEARAAWQAKLKGGQQDS